ncbi:STAS domain-containing protein [Streptomyces sp. NPDC006458]|uniref:STAS domain-containing protein n=1 Tax=Streptomyces sp. NPDC006458 TaxID=3154302 RepID=UPI0033B98E54
MYQHRHPRRAGTTDAGAGDALKGTQALMPCEPVVVRSERNGHVRVKVSGELDIAAGPALRSALDAAVDRCAHVMLDLTGVTFCDCSGLNVMLAAQRHAAAQGKTLSVRAAGPAVEGLLTRTGTWSLLTRTQPEEDVLSDGEEDLEEEVVQLRRAMLTRPQIDQATGILMATFSLSSEDAWSVLVRVSQNTNTKLHHVAEELLRTVRGQTLPETMRTQFGAAVSAIRDGGAPAE